MIQKQEPEGPAELRSIWKVAARVPWPAVLSVCLYLPGIVLWSVYSLRCKASTFVFLSTVAPVSSETVDAVTNTVNTTLITLAAGGTFIFALLLVLAIARSIQVAGVAPNAFCPCARPTPSSFYMYRVFNLGFNIIVFFVDMAIILLMMGAFLWLVVAYAANVSIKFGVRDAKASGIDPLQQFNLANQNYSTVVSYYEKQLRATPPCVVNTMWFKGLNSSISSILDPAPDASGGSNTLLCPQSCLNLGSFATLFKLSSNCICDQEQLYTLQDYSMTVSTEAGVALGGSILIYLACTCLHAYLIGQYVHAGYDYKAAKQHYAELLRQRRRRRQGHNSGSTGPKGGPHSGDGPPPPPGSGGPGSSHLGRHSHSHHGSSGYNSSRLGHHQPNGGPHSSGPGHGQYHNPASDYGGVNGTYDVETGGGGGKGAPAAAAAAAAVSAVASKGSADAFVYSYYGDGYDTEQQHDSRLGGVARGVSVAKQQQQLGQRSSSEADHAQLQHPAAAAAAAASHLLPGHSRQSSGSSSAAWNSGNAAVHGRQRSLSAGSGSGAAAAAAGVPGSWQLGQAGVQGASTPAGQSPLARVSPIGAPVGLSSVDEQGQLRAQGLRPPLAAVGGRGFVHSSSLHSRSESRSSAGSIREILMGAVPMDQLNAGHSSSTAAGRLSVADAAAMNSGDSNSGQPGVSNNSGSSSNGIVESQQGQLMRRDSRDGRTHHKPSSSSESYESMIYHSPRTSDCGGTASPAGAALAGAAAAAGLLDLSPAGLNRMLQQQPERRGQQQGVWSVLSSGGPATILESSSEQLTSSPAASPAAKSGVAAETAAALATPAAAGAAAAAAAGDAGSFYNSYNSTGSQTGSLAGSQTGSLTGSGRRSRQSHRRLPAFDLTNVPTNFVTVEGLEEQQELARSAANTRPCSPAGISGAASGAASGTASGGGVAGAAAAALAAAAAPGRQGSPGAAAAEGEVQTAQQQPSAAAGSVEGAASQQQQQQQQRGLPARRNISAPANLQLPAQEESQSGAVTAVTTQPQQQQQQQRTLMASPLLPPEAQQMLLQHQQQQLALLLQQDAQQQQWQQPSPLPGHHRQWSTPSSSSVAAAASGSSSPGSFFMQQQQQQYVQHHQHHNSAPAVDPNGALAPYSSFGLGSVSAALQRDALYLQQQQQLQGLVPGLGSNSSPAGSTTMMMYATLSGSPAPIGNSSITPSGTPRPVPAGLGSLLPPASLVMYQQQQQQQLPMLPPMYGSTSAGYGASSNSTNAYQQGASSSSTPRGVANFGGSSSSVTTSPGGVGMQLSSSAGSSSLNLVGSSLPPTIPESYSSDAGMLDPQGAGSMAGSSSSGMGSVAGYGPAAAGQADVASGSPLERRRSGYRSSLRKGLMAYDQYKHRHRYQQEVSQPLDPRTEISRRYRNRVPAI